jgi:hypothetical protein
MVSIYRKGNQPKVRRREAEDIPVGSIVKTPMGKLARVTGYRGGKDPKFRPNRPHATRLVCVYLEGGKSGRPDVVQLLPDLVTIESLPLKEAA